jgi:hypothetical protein
VGRNHKPSDLVIWRQSLLALALVTVACGTSPQPDTDTDLTLASLDGVPNGSYLLGITLVPAGGLVVPFQVDLVAGHNPAGDRVFSEVVARAVGSSGEVSDVLQTSQDVAITADNHFSLSFELTVPGAFSPTLSDVSIVAELAGEFLDDGFLCGTVSGEITTFEMDLAGSTFGMIDWDERASGSAGSCDDDPSATLPRMAVEDCPDLHAGLNTGFVSAGVDRSFELQLPPHYTDGMTWPLVVAWHGFGGTATGFVSGDLSQSARERDLFWWRHRASKRAGLLTLTHSVKRSETSISRCSTMFSPV